MSLNIAPAHVLTVINATHESYLSAARRADDESRSPGDRAAFRTVAMQRRDAFEAMMRELPVVDGEHRIGPYFMVAA
jgi:hypothetical protein